MEILIADVVGDITLVLIVSGLFGVAARRLGQPAVIGQVIGGILLGPSLLGRLPGHLARHLFPPQALPALTVLAQVAVVIFMFVVGYELDRRSVRGQGRAALLVAGCALLTPLGLGSGAVLVFRHDFAALGEAHAGHSYVLFIGIALSITALPVLAAIVRERDIGRSIASVTAMTAAGIMDVAAWLLLGAVLVSATHTTGRPWPVSLLLIGCFGIMMLVAVRPALRWWVARRRSVLSDPLPVALTLALGSAWVTATLGLHPVFGGFVAGLAMPWIDGVPDAGIVGPLEKVGGMLLPLFFMVAAGLSVNIGAISGTALVVLAVVTVIAIAGKIGPAYAACRACRMQPADAATVAALVNTRGLTELIALNAGLSAGVISDRLFTVLVLMALMTTVLTVPLLDLMSMLTASRSAADSRVKATR